MASGRGAKSVTASQGMIDNDGRFFGFLRSLRVSGFLVLLFICSSEEYFRGIPVFSIGAWSLAEPSSQPRPSLRSWLRSRGPDRRIGPVDREGRACLAG